MQIKCFRRDVAAKYFKLMGYESRKLQFLTLTNYNRAAKLETPGAPLAQMVEQLTLNQWVRGSSPRWRTIFIGQVGRGIPPFHFLDGIENHLL